MATFLSLPREIRDTIYLMVFKDTKVIFITGLEIESLHAGFGLADDPPTKYSLAPGAALMICSKTIYNDCRVLFFYHTSIDITWVTNWETGVLDNRIKPEQLRKVKLYQSKLKSSKARQLIRSLVNLVELTYYGSHEYFMVGYCDSEGHSDCGEACPIMSIDDSVVSMVRDSPERMIGHCYMEVEWSPGECDGGQPVRSLVAAWDYLGQPFKLLAQVTFAEEGRFLDGILDLNTKTMTIVNFVSRKERVFKVDMLMY